MRRVVIYLSGDFHMPKFYSVNEAAELLGISVSLFNKMIASGDFYVHKFGDRNVLSEDDLIEGAAHYRRKLNDQLRDTPPAAISRP
jgi:excisionase family DNA binding protein